MIDSYITVSRRAAHEMVIRKSRFIGFVSPAETEIQALSFLRMLKEEHRNATHHCYAYIIGENNGIMRYSDDGEPGGTAGLPIMEVLKNRKVVNCCVVVVRYFGGVLLGTGGLARAYSQSCQLALDDAGLARMELTAAETCRLPYACWDRFRYAAEKLPVKIENVSYGESVCFLLLVRSKDRDTCLAALAEALGRKLNASPEGESFQLWEL